MSKRASPKLIGAFVVGAVALVVVGVLLLGNLKALFERHVRVVMLFDGDVNGLTVGAPISFRGVKLGQVSDFHVKVGSGGKILVYGQFPPRILDDDAVKIIQLGITRGLRAQLATQSLLTGQLYINLKLMPEVPAKLEAVDPHAIEIPTVPSTLQEWSTQIHELLHKISALPLDEMIRSATGAMGAIKDLAASPDLHQAIREAGPMITSFTATSDTARGAVTDVAQDLRKLAANLETTSDAAKGFLTDGQKLVRDVDAKVDPVAASFIGTMEKAQGTLAGVDGVLTERSPLGYQLGQAIQQLTAAARSIRDLADYLDQHPESLLVGKRGAGAK